MGTLETPRRAEELAVGRRWTFGRAVLDERTLDLAVDGELAQIERKPLEMLLYLLHHAGEVVTKEELAENLWPGRILTESVLTRCISQLRQVLHDDDRSIIRTVHGFGYRLVAEVKVDACTAPTPPAFEFKAGDQVPHRSQWRLVERLGAGGHGEAWLARHDKTHDARVFKFALDQSALASLKREITLYRLLRDSLGKQAAVAQVLEWNLEEPPYFIETEYVEGRDLCAWAEACGGIAGVPLSTRLDLVAQIAEALAAAHSVGVLHKDLKPGNVLIASPLPAEAGRGRAEGAGEGRVRIKLADFGSGGVLDAARLEQLGITRLGFTKTMGGDGSATPLYLAPEVVAGQPFTVAADVYALGVMLYQLVVGDLRKPLAPGWELDVSDELLREDIAAAAAGDPARRLADAAQLATRLRSLESRRETRAAEVAARERAERARRIMQELRRTRAFLLAVAILAMAAIAGGITAYRARNDALEARATTEAINDFLTEGVLSVDPHVEKPKDASYESLLSRAASQVDTRFKGQSAAAARVHWLLGRRFQEVSRLEQARAEFEKSAALFPQLRGAQGLPAMLSQDRLVPIYNDSGRQPVALALSEELLRNWVTRYGQTNLSTLLLRARMARNTAFAGELKMADKEFRAIMADLPLADPPADETRVVLKEWLGVILAADASRLTTNEQVTETVAAHINGSYAGYLGEFAEAFRESQAEYRAALPILLRTSGPESEIVAFTRLGLALAHTALSQQEEAQDQVRLAQKFFESALPPKHWLRAAPALFKGRLELEQQHPNSAIATLSGALSLCVEGGCSPRIAEEIRYDLGRAFDQSGDLKRAIELYRRSLTAYELLRSQSHIGSLKRRLSLVDALRRSEKPVEASSALDGITAEALQALPPPHLVFAEFKRVQGLLWLAEGRPVQALSALKQALEIVEYRFGRDHWRSKRARMELALAGESH